MNKKYWAVIPAAGIGSRMQSEQPKQYLKANGITLLEHILQCLCEYPKLSGIAVAINSKDKVWETLPISSHPKITTVQGGQERQDSVLSGAYSLRYIAAPNDWVLVHDAARPCLSHQLLDRLIAAVQDEPVGGLLAIQTPDTMKQAGDDGRISHTVPRQNLWQAQTPQIFPFSILIAALELALKQKKQITDEAMAMEAIELRPKLVPGDASNIKVTYPKDLLLAQAILSLHNQ